MTANISRYVADPSIRWIGSFVFVVTMYLVVGFTVFYWHTPNNIITSPPMSAIMIELAPMPEAPKATSIATAVGLTQEETPSQKLEPKPIPKTISKPIIDDLPKRPVVKKSDLTLPPKPEKIKPLPEPPDIEKKAEEKANVLENVMTPMLAQRGSAPPTVELPQANKVAAPINSVASFASANALATWKSAVLGQLDRHKRYPRKAKRKKQEATVYVWINMKRDGSILETRLERPSAYEVLNEEALALILRAQPLLPLPPEVAGDTISFVAPVEFFLER